MPGNKTQTPAAIQSDMAEVAKVTGPRAVVFTTERESAETRQAVSDGLGDGWTRVIENENTIARGSAWTQAPGQPDPSALLLAKADPHLAGVSPNRYLDKFFGVVKGLSATQPVALFGTHLLSEANCEHVNVKARAWREKMWPVQVADVLDECERVHAQGVPIVLAGDFNTGIHFTGKQLFALLVARFGAATVTHVHDGALDHIFLISSDTVRLSEVGTEALTNNASDHDSVLATIRAELTA